MTNLEANANIIAVILSDSCGINKETGEIDYCPNMNCAKCKFGALEDCSGRVIEWMEWLGEEA